MIKVCSKQNAGTLSVIFGKFVYQCIKKFTFLYDENLMINLMQYILSHTSDQKIESFHN